MKIINTLIIATFLGACTKSNPQNEINTIKKALCIDDFLTSDNPSF